MLWKLVAILDCPGLPSRAPMRRTMLAWALVAVSTWRAPGCVEDLSVARTRPEIVWHFDAGG